MSSEGNAIIRFPAETRIARVAVATDETRRTVDIEIITAYTCDLGGAIVAVVKDGEAASEWLGVSNKVRFTAHLDTHQPFGVFNPQAYLDLIQHSTWPGNSDTGVWVVGEDAMWAELERQLLACPLIEPDWALDDRIYYEYNLAAALRAIAEERTRKVEWEDEIVPLVMSHRPHITKTAQQQVLVELIGKWFASTMHLITSIEQAHSREWLTDKAYHDVIIARNAEIMGSLLKMALETHAPRFVLSGSPTGQDFSPAKQQEAISSFIEGLSFLHQVELTS